MPFSFYKIWAKNGIKNIVKFFIGCLGRKKRNADDFFVLAYLP